MIATDRLICRTLLAALALILSQSFASAQVPDGPIVAEVVTSGNRITPRDQIIGQLKTRPGLTFSEQNARDDVQKLKESGAFADVRVLTRPGPDKKLIVIFELAELPSLIREVVYKGARHMKQAELEALSGLRRGAPLNPTANLLACRAIEAKYREDGRQFAKVILEEGDKVGDTRVVFAITEGPELKVKSIKFTGQGDWVSQARLRTQVNSSSAILGIGGVFDPRKLEADVMQLREYYKNLGYLDAKIDHEVQFTRDQSGVILVFHIDEGPRYKVAKVEVAGNKQYESPELMKLVGLKEGTTYDQNVVKADVKAIEDKYGYHGRRAQVREKVVATQNPGEVAVQYEVQEQGVVRVRQILIVGN